MRRLTFAFIHLGVFAACSGGTGHHLGSGGAAGDAESGTSGMVDMAGGLGAPGGSSGSSARGGAAGVAGHGGAAGTAGAQHQGGALATGGAGASGEAGLGGAADEVGLSWPIDCIPDQTCTGIGYPDTDKDGQAHDCGAPGYPGHEGTDISISAEAMVAGTAVRAAADGVVLFAFDGKFDQCPNANEADCQDPPSLAPDAKVGNTVCTPLGPYCGTGTGGGSCFWCFAGGNVIVIRHQGVPGVFATRYDHLKRGSVRVSPGNEVKRGQQIAEAASAGNSTGPHLHFEVWGTGFYELADPWVGPCGPNHGPSLWAHEPPWAN